ncbi:MAG TPA: TlpA disulfide reductase family protein [Candidatus Limnocylindrales bacterium]|nr:TlpA disulfide reductase family protein [Candidatus Limnocylindrales bacterium]
MRGKSAVIGGVALALGSIVLLSLWWGLQHAALSNPPVLGRSAPELAIQPASGDQVRLSALRGKAVVLNFWASWCEPCVQEGTVLAGGATAHPSIAFVGADNRDTDSAFQSFETAHPHPYPAGPIVSGSYQSYGVAGLPSTFFIDAQGVVVASFTGPLTTSLLDHYLKLVAP